MSKSKKEEEIFALRAKLRKLEEGVDCERESTAPLEVPDSRRDSRNVSPAIDSRTRSDISPATQVRDQPPVALGTPSSPPSVVRDPDEQRVLPQPNLNLTDDNTVDSNILTITVPQQTTRKKKKSSAKNTNDHKKALNKAATDDPSLYGEKIHADLTNIWENILLKGLAIDVKDKLLKDYAVPDNCTFLKAPTLNNEIYNIAEFSSKEREKILEGNQNQLGLGISAIGKALTMLLNQDENYEVNATTHLNHGCRLLLDLHYNETMSRRRLFKSELNRSGVFHYLEIQDLERDDTLFGNKLAKMVKEPGFPPTPAHQRPSSSYGDLPPAPHHNHYDQRRYRR